MKEHNKQTHNQGTYLQQQDQDRQAGTQRDFVIFRTQ